MNKTVAQGLTGRALGEAVIGQILTSPERHEQETFFCGTTACIAGWAIALHHGIQQEESFEDRARERAYASSHSLGGQAADFLGLNYESFIEAVVSEEDRDTAIFNFKHLLDETYSERAS